MKLLLKICISIILVSLLKSPGEACTVFYAADSTKVLAATNKDWNNLNTRIRIIPASEGKYGIIYFGYNIPEGFQNVGGVNEHGLWYDGASLPERHDISNYYNKPEYRGELCEKALEECTTVDEVIALYSAYYTPHWQGHSMWGDKNGNSVVLEFGEKDVSIIKREGSYQLMTNFYLQDTINTRWINCRRFQTAEQIIESAGDISVDLFTMVLNAVHQHGFTPTLYSNIYDLSNGAIYIYNFHRYTEVVKIEIAAMLEMGDQNISLPDLFHQIVISGPVNGGLVNYEKILLSWTGEPGLYSIMYSENPEFEDYTIVDELPLNKEKSGVIYCSLIAPLILAIFLREKKRLLKPGLLIMVLITMLPLSCVKELLDPYPDSDIVHEVELTGLIPDKLYYWKVLCTGEDEFVSESPVHTFVTGNFFHSD